MERFVERDTLTNMHNVSKNVSVLLNGTVHTQVHVNAHLDTQCDVIARTKYRRCRGDMQTLSPHVSECFHARTHVARQIARHVERIASECESTITLVDCDCATKTSMS